MIEHRIFFSSIYMSFLLEKIVIKTNISVDNWIVYGINGIISDYFI